MRSWVYYVKLFFLIVVLFGESFLLTTLINNYVSDGDFFNINLQFSAQIVGLMALLILTYSLTVGAWEVWYFNILSPLAIASGIMIPLLAYQPTYAIIAAGIAFIVITLESYRSYRIKKILIKFEALLVLRFAAKGILLVFSILAGLIIILGSNNIKDLDFGKMVATVAEKPIKNSVNTQLQETIENQTIYSGYTEEEVNELLKQYGLETGLSAAPDASSVDVDIKSMIEEQVNSAIEPYKELVRPVIAVLMFGVFQLYATISYVLYSVFVGIFIAIAKKTGILRVVTETVEKEDLRF